MKALLAILTLSAMALATSPAVAQLEQGVPEDMMSSFRWRGVGPANMSGRITDVEGIGGRIEACIEGDRAVGETFG
jgi:hypothetical protein